MVLQVPSTVAGLMLVGFLRFISCKTSLHEMDGPTRRVVRGWGLDSDLGRWRGSVSEVRLAVLTGCVCVCDMVPVHIMLRSLGHLESREDSRNPRHWLPDFGLWQCLYLFLFSIILHKAVSGNLNAKFTPYEISTFSIRVIKLDKPSMPTETYLCMIWWKLFFSSSKAFSTFHLFL